jgi:hypothetical protein
VVDLKEVKKVPIHILTQYPQNFAQTMPIQLKQVHIYDTATFQNVVNLCVKALHPPHHHHALHFLPLLQLIMLYKTPYQAQLIVRWIYQRRKMYRQL